MASSSTVCIFDQRNSNAGSFDSGHRCGFVICVCVAAGVINGKGQLAFVRHEGLRMCEIFAKMSEGPGDGQSWPLCNGVHKAINKSGVGRNRETATLAKPYSNLASVLLRLSSLITRRDNSTWRSRHTNLVSIGGWLHRAARAQKRRASLLLYSLCTSIDAGIHHELRSRPEQLLPACI